jgi:hypothetical protein
MSIRIHKKHGVNPTMTQCFLCGESKEILLVGSATKRFKDAGVPVSDDGKMPMSIGAIDKEPCQKCEGYMKQGIILISTRDGEEGSDDPYRTGGWLVVKEDAVKRMGLKSPALEERILKQRVCFIPDEAWDFFGLPRGEVEGVPNE